MKNNNNILFLILGLGISAGTLLLDRLIGISDWTAIIMLLFAIGFLIAYISFQKKNKK